MTVIFLSVVIILFIYFVIRCQTRQAGDKLPDGKTYSRELQTHSHSYDDSIIDLSGIN
jgi:hypothetical protein